MLTIKELTVKNFMSVGNAAQSINFSNKNLVLVIGENLDLGGDDAGARNGTGKTTIINALSYVFYGEALTNIRRDNLVNKTNERNMLVSVKFTKNNGNILNISKIINNLTSLWLSFVKYKKCKRIIIATPSIKPFIPSIKLNPLIKIKFDQTELD